MRRIANAYLFPGAGTLIRPKWKTTIICNTSAENIRVIMSICELAKIDKPNLYKTEYEDRVAQFQILIDRDKINKINNKPNGGQLGNALLYRVNHYNACVKFETNERYHFIRKTILNEDDLNWFCVKIPIFCHFFVVFPDCFENVWTFLTFGLYYAPKIFTLSSETTPELWCTQTRSHIIVKSIHSSLRSEFKTMSSKNQFNFDNFNIRMNINKNNIVWLILIKDRERLKFKNEPTILRLMAYVENFFSHSLMNSKK
ncbi:hypothetical protein AGLY_013717 [Aphis glycines]|uniref:Uncharacterized protein n=1 Tax=Aphis glycines TaxID=307491 RepID=A0A6G0T979_APHGL|nr:hypothetical protein AGLY_013717 [Aphis glycines]